MQSHIFLAEYAKGIRPSESKKKEPMPESTGSFLARLKEFESPTFRLGVWRTVSYDIQVITFRYTSYEHVSLCL